MTHAPRPMPTAAKTKPSVPMKRSGLLENPTMRSKVWLSSLVKL